MWKSLYNYKITTANYITMHLFIEFILDHYTTLIKHYENFPLN